MPPSALSVFENVAGPVANILLPKRACPEKTDEPSTETDLESVSGTPTTSVPVPKSGRGTTVPEIMSDDAELDCCAPAEEAVDDATFCCVADALAAS